MMHKSRAIYHEITNKRRQQGLQKKSAFIAIRNYWKDAYTKRASLDWGEMRLYLSVRL